MSESRLAQRDAAIPGDKARPLKSELLHINMGPQHPATHGVLRCVVKLDGELIEKCVLDIGYLHRGTEKLFELHPFVQNVPHTDRMDCASCHSAWTNNCIGCHLYNEYNADPNNFQFSNITGQRIEGHDE